MGVHTRSAKTRRALPGGIRHGYHHASHHRTCHSAGWRRRLVRPGPLVLSNEIPLRSRRCWRYFNGSGKTSLAGMSQALNVPPLYFGGCNSSRSGTSLCKLRPQPSPALGPFLCRAGQRRKPGAVGLDTLMGVLGQVVATLYCWPVSVCPHPRHSPTTASARARVGAVSLEPLLSESPADLSTPAIGGGSRFAARREVARDQQKARHRFLRGDGLPQKKLRP